MIVCIKVKAGAKENKIIKKDNNNWEIKTTKIANNNEANLEIINLISKDLKISKSKVQIVSGLKCKNKKVEIQI